MTQLKVNPHKIIPVSILAFFVIAFFSKVIYSGTTLYGTDFLAYFYPLKAFIFDHFSVNGSVPLWNPFQFSGTPVIANMQASMFYPLGFLYYLMPTDAAYLYSTVLHCILAAVFMYLFVRSLGTSKTGAFLSGFIFAFNGYFIAHIYAGHLSFVQNYIWIPLLFFFVHRFLILGRLNYVFGAGLILGIQILGGFPQIAFYTILAMVLFSCYEAVRFTVSQLSLRRHRSGSLIRTGIPQGIPIHTRDAGFPLEAGHEGNSSASDDFDAAKTRTSRRHGHLLVIGAGTVLVIVIGFSLSAIQVVPTYEFLQLSTRAGGIPYGFAVMDSLPPINLITFLIPDFFGNPTQGTFWVSKSTWQFWEFCAYVGLVPLLLVFMSIRRLISDRIGLFFLLLALLSVFLAFGKYNPIYPLIYRLPGFHSFRIPAQILFLYVFSISVLAGKAFDSLRNGAQFEKRASSVFAGCVLFIALAIFAWVRLAPTDMSGVLLRLTAAPIADPSFLGRVTEIVGKATLKLCAFALAFLAAVHLGRKKSLGGPRIFYGLIGLSIMDLASFCFPMVQPVDIQGIKKRGNALGPIVQASNLGRALIRGRCFIANAGLWYGFEDIQGYDPLILRRYMEYIHRSQRLPPDAGVVNLHHIQEIDNKLIRMLNLKYVLDCESRTLIDMRNPVERAYIVHRALVIEEKDVLNFMSCDLFDPMGMVVLESGEQETKNISDLPSHGYEEERAVLTKRRGHELVARVQMKSPGYLVLSEIHYPGWRAYVDGEETAILKGNYLFRTVALAAGDHEVKFVFKPKSFILGLLITLSALVLVLGVLFYHAARGLRKASLLAVSKWPTSLSCPGL